MQHARPRPRGSEISDLMLGEVCKHFFDGDMRGVHTLVDVLSRGPRRAVGIFSEAERERARGCRGGTARSSAARATSRERSSKRCPRGFELKRTRWTQAAADELVAETDELDESDEIEMEEVAAEAGANDGMAEDNQAVGGGAVPAQFIGGRALDAD